MSEGSAFGDDYQASTDYPLVQITNESTGTVTYARTFGMTNRSIAPGAAECASFVLPAAADGGTSDLRVITNGIASAPVQVTVGSTGANTTSCTPTVGSFTPTHGAVGTNVTINGSGLLLVSGVSFNGTPATTFSTGSGTSLTVTVPAGATTGAVSVTTATGNTTSGSQFTVTLGPPAITGFTPVTAAVGSTVTLTGTNLLGATAVTVDGTSAPFSVASVTALTFTVPAAATTGTVTVATPSGSTTSAASLTIAPPPTITSVAPLTGPVGTPVTVTGTNLDHVVGVRLGSVITVPTATSATQITFAIPPGAVSGHIQILATNGTATSTDTFTVTG